MITFYDWNFKIIENDLTSFDFIFICNNNQLVMIFFLFERDGLHFRFQGCKLVGFRLILEIIDCGSNGVRQVGMQLKLK